MTETTEKEANSVPELNVHEDTDVIVLGEQDAAIVVKDRGTIELYFPEQEDDVQATPSSLLVAALARIVSKGSPLLVEALEEIGAIADELEELEKQSKANEEELSVTSDTKCPNCGSDNVYHEEPLKDVYPYVCEECHEGFDVKDGVIVRQDTKE